jgi:trehalose 6-phosphate phosphatase
MLRESGQRTVKFRRAGRVARVKETSPSHALPEHLQALGTKPLVIVLNCDVMLLPLPSQQRDHKAKLEFKDTLVNFVGHPFHRLYLVTGLRSKQLEAELSLPHLPVIGLHGLEWPGEALPNPNWGGLRQLLADLSDLGGVRLENRGLSLLVHYRNLAPGWQADIENYLGSLTLPRGWECVMTKYQCEYRPQGCGKGYIVERLRRTSPEHVVLVGGDSSDEEGFLKVQQLGGTTIKLGVGKSSASYRLHDLASLTQVLEEWVRYGD